MATLRLRFARPRGSTPRGLEHAALDELPVAAVAVSADSGALWLNRWAREDAAIRRGARTALAGVAARALAGEGIAGERVEFDQGHVMSVDAAPITYGDESGHGAILLVRHASAREELEAAMGARTSASILLFRAVDGQIVASNPAAERSFGYARGELDGRHISAVYAPTDRTPQDRAHEILGALQHDGQWGAVVHSLRKDGSTFWSYAEIVAFDDPVRGQLWLSTQVEATARDRDEAAQTNGARPAR